MAGPRVRDLFRQLPGTGANDDFGTALVKRNEYFEPQVSRFYEVYEFRQAKPCGQDAIFSDSDYIYSINKKAVKNPTVDVKVCGTSFQVTIDASEFHDLDFEIPIQLVLHGSSSQLRKHALRDNTVTLKNMLLLGRQEELSHFQAAKIEGKDTEDLNYVQKKCITSRHVPHKTLTRKCFSCGGDFPHSGLCPAQGKTCRLFCKMNLFASVCKSKKAQHHNRGQAPYSRKTVVHPLRVAEDDFSDSDYICSINND